jgi:serine/threonine protein kinase
LENQDSSLKAALAKETELNEIMHPLYKNVQYLEKGGLSFLYTATDVYKRESVVVKVPKDHSLNSAALREKKTLKQFTHPNIPRLREIGQDREGSTLIVMEHVKGKDIARTLNMKDMEEQEYRRTIDIVRVVRSLVQVCTALEYAHTKNCIHYDIKPTNVMLETSVADKPERSVLIDWGLSQEKGSPSSPEVVVGTMGLIDPASLRNGHVHNPMNDVFGVGATLYQTLTQQTPYDPDINHFFRLLRGRSAMDTPLRSVNARVPKDLETLCDAMLLCEQDERPTMPTVRERLQEILGKLEFDAERSH